MRRTLTALLPALALVVTGLAVTAGGTTAAGARTPRGGAPSPSPPRPSARRPSGPSTSPSGCSTGARRRATRRRRWPCATCGRRCPRCPPPGGRAPRGCSPGRPTARPTRSASATPRPRSRGAPRTSASTGSGRTADAPPEQEVGQAHAQGDAARLPADDRPLRLPQAAEGRQPGREQEVRRLPQGHRPVRPLRLLRRRDQGAALPGHRLLRARQRLLAHAVPLLAEEEPQGHRRPRVLPRRAVRLRRRGRPLADGGHGHLDGGAARRQRQRQPAVPPLRPGAATRASRSTPPVAAR